MKMYDEYTNHEGFRNHIAWLLHYKNLIADNKMIKGAVILGSFAKGSADRLSDIDLVVFAEKNNLASVADVLLQQKLFNSIYEWRKEYSADHIFGKYIYDNFVSAEIHVLSLENDFKIRRPFVTLKDTEEVITKRLEEGEPPKHEYFDALPAGVEGLGWELFDMLKWWQRGKTDLVKSHLKKIAQKL